MAAPDGDEYAAPWETLSEASLSGSVVADGLPPVCPMKGFPGIPGGPPPGGPKPE